MPDESITTETSTNVETTSNANVNNMSDIFGDTSQDSSQQNINENTDSNATNEPKYFYAKDIPGIGEKPEYLLDKYATVEEQAQAYKAVQAMLGRAKDLEGIVGAPEAYVIPEELQANEGVSKYAELSKKYGFNQKFFDEGLQIFKNSQEIVQNSYQVELAKLGENGQERQKVLGQWVKNNFKPEIFTALKSIPFKAEVIEFFEGVKSMTTQTTIPGSNGASVQGNSIDSVKNEIRENFDKVRKDPEYARSLMEKMNKAGGRSIGKR